MIKWKQKLLSLTLAAVLSVGLLTVGAGAAFTDQNQITQTAAVAECVRLKIINGFPDGSFRPKDRLTREQMSKMICIIGNKGRLPAQPSRSSFKDVPLKRWSAPYIEFCAKKQIVNGVGGGRFSPQGDLNYIQAGKMLLVLMQYDPNREGMTGSGWSYNTTLLAEQHNLFYRILQPNILETMTREDAAQMIYNGLNANMVGYASNGKVYEKDATIGSYYLGLPAVTTE